MPSKQLICISCDQYYIKCKSVFQIRPYLPNITQNWPVFHFMTLQGVCEIHFELWFMFLCAPSWQKVHFETHRIDLRWITCVKLPNFHFFYWQNAHVWAHSCFQPGNLDKKWEQLRYISIHILVLRAAVKLVTVSINWEIGIFIVFDWLNLKRLEFSFKNGWTP